MPFDPNQATARRVPTFKIGAVGDGFKIRITDISDDVTTTNDNGGEDTHLVLAGTVLAAKGGERDDKDQPTTDTPAGEARSIWLRYRRDGRSYPQPLTTACALALRDSGRTQFEIGGELAAVHDKLGDKPKDPKHSRAKLFTAKYTPPTAAAKYTPPTAAANDLLGTTSAPSSASWAAVGGQPQPATVIPTDPWADADFMDSSA